MKGLATNCISSIALANGTVFGATFSGPSHVDAMLSRARSFSHIQNIGKPTLLLLPHAVAVSAKVMWPLLADVQMMHRKGQKMCDGVVRAGGGVHATPLADPN